MPVTVTYPGVYVEEVPSGVRAITGVATSIAAFVGRARRGPVDAPVVINSYADFERIYGPLWIHSQMGYAVRDFYRNGGSQAVVVRLYRGAEGEAARATLGVLGLEARYPGDWGNRLRVRIDHDVRPRELPGQPPEPDPDLFNLYVRDGETGQIEEFRNVSVIEDHPRQVDRVLHNQSRLVRFAPAYDGGDETFDPGQGLPAERPAAHPAPPPGEDVWFDAPPDADPATLPYTRVAEDDQASDGAALEDDDFIGPGTAADKRGLYALAKADLFTILSIPPYTATGGVDAAVIGEAARFCEDHRALLLVDPPPDWTAKDQVTAAAANMAGAVGTVSKNAALFFPRLRQPNPELDDQLDDFAPSGAVAGVLARTDATRGVWKAPAGLEATLTGVPALSVNLTDAENGELNPLGVNSLRIMPAVGPVVWGSRTLQGNDRLGSEWKYIPVRRTALYIEESLYRGLQWVVFEPNDEPLWGQIRLNVGAFLNNLFRQGAFQGASPREAYFVKCDKETTTQNDIDRGIVNIIVGFAPLKPAEFVIIKLQQIAGQIQT